MSDFPDSIKLSKLSPISEKFDYLFEANNLKKHVRRTGIQRWSIEIETIPLDFEQAMRFNAFWNLNGSTTPFHINIPREICLERFDSTCSATGAGVNKISMSGNHKEGSLFNFSNHNKLYMIVSTDNENSLQTIEPTLKTSISSNTMAMFSRVRLFCSFNESKLTMDTDENGLTVFTFIVDEWL